MTRQTFRNVITTPELIEQIEPENKKLVQRFLKEKSTRCSSLTTKNYESDMMIFFCWNVMYNNNQKFTDIRKITFADFFGFCIADLRWSSARFSREKSTLSSFSNFIEKFFDDQFPLFRSCINKAVESMPKNIAREKTVLSEEQVKSILNYLENDIKDYQLLCWFSLAISSGARFAELLRFNVDNIDLNHTAFDEIFLETLKPIKTKGRGRNGKLLTKYIIKETFWKYYQLWLPERQRIMDENKKNHNSIFIKNNGDPAEESTARGWIEKIEKFMGFPVYVHCFRHFYTTYLSKMGLPYELIKSIVGWESINMVENYDDLTARDKSWAELDNLKNELNKNK